VEDRDTAEPALTEVTKREGAAARPKPEYLSRGTLVGRYVVLDVVGEGGMGVVYSAFDHELDRKVAIKLLQAKSGGSSGGQAWLLREAQALARLAHPNVIAVHDVGSLPGDRVFVAMEMVEGVTLRRWLKADKRSWRDVVPVMLGAGAGLAAAHAAGLIHRDFKPENVLVGNDGRVRVMDFGLARLADEEPASRDSDLRIESRSPLSESLTVAGTVIGTPAYMAPELYEGGSGADARTDQFAFGVALFEALYRTRPYDKDDLRRVRETQRDLAAGSLSMKPKAGDASVPARIHRIAMRAIALDPAARFASMDALLGELSTAAAPRRGRVLLAGVAFAGIAGAGAIAYFANRSETALCTGIDKHLAGVWDPSTKQTVHAAFTATKKSFAEQSFAGVSRALDAYAGDWTHATADSCEATRIRGEQADDVFALRQACFDQRLDELHAVTRLLATADAALVERGDKVVFGLEPIATCSNVTALRGPGLAPAAIRTSVDDQRKKLAEAKAQFLAGKYLSALVTANAVVEAAKQLHYDPLAAEALVVYATGQQTTGQLDGALVNYSDATFTAVRGKRDDVVATASLGAATLASDAGKSGEARIWLSLGEAAAARSGLTDVLAAHRMEIEGVVLAQAGDTAAGLAAHEKAYEIAAKNLGRDNPALWPNEMLYATTLTKAGSYAKAAPHFEHALALREGSVGPDHPDIALIKSNLGVAYRHLGQTAKSRQVFEHALAIREATYGKNSPLLVPTLDNFTELLKQVGDIPAALATIERGVKLATLLPGKQHPAFHVVATTYAEVLIAAGRLADAHRQYDELFVLEEQTKSNQLPMTLASRAELSLAESKWPEAVTFAERSIAGFEAAGGKEQPDLWRPLTALGRAQLALHRDADARAALERAIAIGTKFGLTDDLDAARREIAKLH
jgi:tetratricopeptide (TPR) repeat protein